MEKKLLKLFLICVVLSIFATQAFGIEVKLNPDTILDISTTLKWGGAWRVKDQDDKILKDINADDGDRNFDKGDMINNRFSVLIDMGLKYKNVGLFIRPRVFYDFAYARDKNANDSPFTNNNIYFYGGPLSRTDEFMDETKDLHRNKFEILDAYVYGEFNIKGHKLNLRIGKQVVSWGESLFLQNSISSAQSPLDVTAAHSPGTELKDIFLPVGQVYAQFDVTDALTIESFYQFQWEETRLDEAGSYFSSTDYLYRGGRRYLIPVLLNKGLVASIDKKGIDYAKDSGQWGVALRYFAEKLNATEFGVYYINYHEKLPEIIGRFSGGQLSRDWTKLVPGVQGFILNLVDQSSYELKYPENVHLLGFSFGTVFGDTNVAGEVSYRWDFPVMVTDPKNILKFSYKDACILQAQFSFIHLLSQRFAILWNDATFMGEIGFNQVNGVRGSKLKYDKFAWGGTLKFSPKYFNVIVPSLDITIPITYKFNPSGTSSVLGTFKEHTDSFSIGVEFKYLEVYNLGIKYTTFFGDPEDNPLTDRDFVSVDFKYTF